MESIIIDIGRGLEGIGYISEKQVANKALNRFLIGVRNKKAQLMAKKPSFDQKVYETKRIGYGLQEYIEKIEKEKKPFVEAESLVLVDILQHSSKLVSPPRNADSLVKQLVQHIKSKYSETKIRVQLLKVLNKMLSRPSLSPEAQLICKIEQVFSFILFFFNFFLFYFLFYFIFEFFF